MSSAEISNVTELLSQTTVQGEAELSFAGKGLKLDCEKDAQEIVDEIEKCDNIRALRLEGNTLGIDAAKYIANALGKHPELERALWSDLFTGRLKTEIPQALRHLCRGMMTAGVKLVELDLSDNAFGPNGMTGLTDFLVSSSCYSLKELRLHNNGLGVTGGKMLAKCLLDSHKASVKAGTPLALRVFVSGRGRLENDGSIALAEAFKAMGSLEEVRMPQNGINHAGITALADSFRFNTNLRHLNLQDNTFTAVGAKSMAEALPYLQKLEIVNFADCLLRNKGALVLANALTDEHDSLKSLDVSFNEIKASGGLAFAEAMAMKTALEQFNIGGNELGEDVIDSVKSVMDENGAQLGSFSDDEGEGDEEDEEQYEDEEEECEEYEEEEEGQEVDDPGLQVQGVAITPRPDEKKVSAADFLAFPSPCKLKGLGNQRGKSIVDHLGSNVEDIDEVMNTLIKISSFVTNEDIETKKEACQCADELLSVALASDDDNVTNAFSNALLVHIGILKSEDKKFRPPSNLNGPLIVLEHIVQQSYFPKTTRNFLQLFLGKPHTILDGCSKSRHTLLQTLYKF